VIVSDRSPGRPSPRYEVPPPPPPRPERARSRAGAVQWTALAAVVAVAVAADQLTKSMATRALAIGDPVEVLPFFSLERIRNTGIAFGQLAGQTTVVTILTLGALTWMVLFFAGAGGRSPLIPVAIGLLMGGAASNLADRLRAGFVTDFLHIERWPIFNLADCFIVAGVVILMLELLREERRRPR
jgi:signal peptidase II